MKIWRINLVLVLIILFGATIIGRLIYIQILDYQYWQALAQGQQQFFASLQGERGEIFLQDKGGNLYPLASNKNWPLVYLSPTEIEKEEEVAQTLSPILNLDQALILEKIQKKETFYQPLKNKLTEEEVANLRKLNLSGVYLGEESLRYYPQEFLASQIIGFLGGDGTGQYGIEGYYNDILEGQDYNQPTTFPLAFVELAKTIKGSDLILTLDYNIQFVAEKLLESAKESLDAEEGQIIVIDPNSGKILALAHSPNFNPNQYPDYANQEKSEIFKNSVTQKLFEPGSVFKPITFAVALEEEKITPQTTYIDTGEVKIDGWPKPIYNYNGRVYGEQTMTNVLEKSINTGAVFVEKKLPHNLFLDYIASFGFFEPTGIDLSETYSENQEFKKGYEINFATVSFGQGIEMTPIQLARAFLAIANGGKLVRPYLVEKIFENGKIIETQSEISSSIISQKTASQLTAMLVSVVENGFGKAAKVPGYYIAGKTGTAQISFSALEIDKPGYSEETIQTFVGFAPAFNPQFLILIKLNNPQTRTAEYSAVPIFRELAKYIIDYYQIPPDYNL